LFLVWTSNERDFTIKILKGKELLQNIETMMIALLYTRLMDNVIDGISVAKIEEAVTATLESLVMHSSIKITL